MTKPNEERAVPPGCCRRVDGLIIEEEFKDDPRRLSTGIPFNILPIVLVNLLGGNGSPCIEFTVSFWIGPLCYGYQDVDLRFDNVKFCRHDKVDDIYEIEMSFLVPQSPKVAEWLIVEGGRVSLFGYWTTGDNHISLYTDRKYAASVLDYRETTAVKTE